MTIWAHTRNPAGERHPLLAHLRDVSALAAEFAASFEGAEPARYLGLWHDLGKFNPAFQAYLLACEENPKARGHGPDHKAAGTLLALQWCGLSALVVQGHHGGLHASTDLRDWLTEREQDPATGAALVAARTAIAELEPARAVRLPEWVLAEPLAAELYLRLLYSALVDADFLDTERHFSPEKAALRGIDVNLEELWRRFEAHHGGLAEGGSETVTRVRQTIYDACLRAAEGPLGLYRLTAPTGGGKTLSGMAFALRHAVRWGLARVIVAVPFISITEQTADVYRGIFGADAQGRAAVLEHHSGVVAQEPSQGDFHRRQLWSRLAAENWDAPIVVTTTVQLFESLFDNRPSRARKLHRLAGSVIILDEAQSLPAELLQPILDALRQLCAHYGATVVISTATQPAFEAIPVFADLPATEIVPAPERLFAALRRVRYEWRTERDLAWEELAQLLGEERQAIAVLNTKADALALLDVLDDRRALHLSTLLCGAHRREVLREVRRRLAAGEECRLISTQVVEAGVNLDFPLVVRALGPLDAIIQAAGRCNREGRLTQGRVVVVRPAGGGLPPGAYRAGAGITAALLERGGLDPDRPESASEYFRQLFQTVQTDRGGIQRLRQRLDYPEVRSKFQMIKPTLSVAITGYGTEDERQQVRQRLQRLRDGYGDARSDLRALQPYLVAIDLYQAERYKRQGFISEVMPGLGEWLGQYDGVRGIVAADVEMIV